MSRKYDYMQIELASPEMIRSWSYGEVLKHETINYRTLKPEKDGLFCEVIFGPTKDYQCACGRSKRNIDKGKKCSKCGVEITESKVRRERMGHIELAAPVVHTWYLKNSPSRLAILLEMKIKDLEEIVYLAAYVVIDPGNTDLEKGRILSEGEYNIYKRKYGSTFKALTGAKAVKKLLQDIKLEEEFDKLRLEVKTATKQKREKIIKRLAVVESFLNSNNKPEWMVLEVLPVIPPDLRPMVQLDGGRFATTDLNDLYRRILNRNNRLKRQYEQNAPDLITKNEKRMLQEAVDALIDNGKRGKKVVVEKNRPLKSLSDMLRGKQGRFRQNLLGKRVDYSGRSVIVVGPDLKMYQCGIPREMAITLFKPFVIRDLIRREIASNIKNAKRLIDTLDDSIWGVLEDVIKDHPVLLNRAPTLHRLGIQSFEPKLVEGKAIRLHPLVTPAFNADFDGDQMAVHVPLSLEAQAEARVLMLASNNILNPKDGKPVVTPSQDMVLGNFYLTIERVGEVGEGRVFKNMNEAEIAYENKQITLHTRIAMDAGSIGIPKLSDKQKNQYLVTTYGKLIFNSIFPKGFPFINEPTVGNLTDKTPDKYFLDRGVNIREAISKMEIVEPFKKKFLGQVISEVFRVFKVSETSKMLDKIKDLGFYYSTIAGITVSAADVTVVEGKKERFDEAESKIRKYEQFYDRGLITQDERKSSIIKIWKETKDALEEVIKETMQKNATSNHIYMMADSGARGNVSNFTQLSGMRGLMAKPSGETMEIPIKSSFREGLTMGEFFISTHGSRKGSTDTALKTADSGYLTRRLVDVAQDVIITEEDCGTENGVNVSELRDDEDGRLIESLFDRISGRYANKNIRHPETGEIIVAKGKFISESKANKIIQVGIEKVNIRTALTCQSRSGICAKCYGKNLATGEAVEIGEAVGTIAAQSIGEPGTQLTMRTFHTGGVAGADITQGLPRIQELFEAREPKGKAIISEINGEIEDIVTHNERYEIIVTNDIETKNYMTDSGISPIVKIGDTVGSGQRLTSGSISPKELLRVSNADAAQQYILKEVQKVYRVQGVEISDKHVEIIINQMMKKVKVVDEGETDLLPGVETSINDYLDENTRAINLGLHRAIGKPLLLGITRASLRSESFLSAASFQETTRVLTDSAIKGKIDRLRGLKENVIIGGLIPAGTGVEDSTDSDFESFEERTIDPDLEEVVEENLETQENV